MENHRLRVQLDEAFGPDNRWYCSRLCGKPVEDKTLLLAHFIRNGGAEDFARRYEEAMGPDNRWYCSQYYRRQIDDPEILWAYYMRHWEPPPPQLGVAC